MRRTFALCIALCVAAGFVNGNGRRSNERTGRTAGLGRIVGGSNIAITQAPYQLQLEDEGWQICGASIIAPFFALTSASCVDGYNQRELTLRAGSDRRSNGGQIHQVLKINIHPNYDDYLHDYDVAVLQVATPFRYDTTRQPLPLATSEPASGSIVTATGWGRTSEEGSTVNQLQSVDIPVFPRSNCTAVYSGDVTLRMMCAGVKGRDTCQGDTGGPLVQAGQQVGVTSWSYGCAQDGYPGVYVNVANSEVRAFINSVINVN